jgi:hypothetical protein
VRRWFARWVLGKAVPVVRRGDAPSATVTPIQAPPSVIDAPAAEE